MKITSVMPDNWRDLQNKAGKYLSEAGYKVTTPLKIQTVRGNTEVDIFVESKNELIKYFICECKYWKTNIPKEKVHAFRNVVVDSGATLGIMISKVGFQKGAIEAACYSNVLLKTWDEFLEMLKTQWQFHQLSIIKHVLHPLTIYMDPLAVPLDALSKDEQYEYANLMKVYIECFLFGQKISISDLQTDTIALDGCEFMYCNELFEYMLDRYSTATKAFAKLFPSIEDNKTSDYTLIDQVNTCYGNEITYM